MMDGFYQQSENSSKNRILEPQRGTFSAYIKVQSNTAACFLVSCDTLHKRCFRFLRKIDEGRKLEIRRAPLINNNQQLNARNRNQSKSAFDRMIAERNSRVKLKKHFQNLYSLLPTNCRKDKLSVLVNTTSYLRELKLRVCEVEQQDECSDDSVTKNFSNGEGGSPEFESHEQSFNSDSSLLYRSDDVVLERCKDILYQVKIIINVQRSRVSCPATLLMKVIALLSAEQLEILSLSHEKGFGFQAIFVVFPKGEDWDISRWRAFASLIICRTLN